MRNLIIESEVADKVADLSKTLKTVPELFYNQLLKIGLNAFGEVIEMLPPDVKKVLHNNLKKDAEVLS